MLIAVQLVAQQGGGDGKGESPPLFANPIFLFVAMGLLFYFLLLRPARRQEKERVAMIDAVKKNDEVVTSGGIIGTVINLKKDKDEVIIESSNTRLRVLKSSIARVLSKSEQPKEEEEETSSDSPDERIKEKD